MYNFLNRKTIAGLNESAAVKAWSRYAEFLYTVYYAAQLEMAFLTKNMYIRT